MLPSFYIILVFFSRSDRDVNVISINDNRVETYITKSCLNIISVTIGYWSHPAPDEKQTLASSPDNPSPHTISCTPAPPFLPNLTQYPISSPYTPHLTPISHHHNHGLTVNVTPIFPFVNNQLHWKSAPILFLETSLLQNYKSIFSKNKPVSKIFRKLINSPQI